MTWRIPFAILISSGPILALINGALGSISNPVLTAAVLGGSTVVIGLFGHYRGIVLREIDVLFAALVATIAVSVVLNGLPPARDAALFALSLAAYPACRAVPLGKPFGAFSAITISIVLLGAIVVAGSLYGAAVDLRGRPVVLGFGHAPTVFLMSLGFLLIVIATSEKLTIHRAIFACVIACGPIVIFAAAQVRFVFVALLIALLASLLVARSRQRVAVSVIVGIFVLAGTIGFAARHQTSIGSLRAAIDPFNGHARSEAEECAESYNTVEMRKTLLRSAVSKMPDAGLFGHGLSSFERTSCLKMFPHNAVLQAAVEFGWLGGAALVLMIVFALRRIWTVARMDREGAFVFSALVFVLVNDLAYGSLVSSGLLFLFLGYAARLTEQSSPVTGASA
ncbi:O-antigen ligase family protein [Bradyrhizobium murdochi]|uniref:O-antigen ligase family protein n=1 Tax=Bradyrhizobium murdochi TaxID=1038859 RepID=UPI00048DAE48|nr:O-antigen ligase family protein [Bradyrhizobium murdochi]